MVNKCGLLCTFRKLAQLTAGTRITARRGALLCRSSAAACCGREQVNPVLWHISQGQPLSVLVIGAHPDDIEIGAGGTLLTLAQSQPGLRAHYVVLTGPASGQDEARAAARSFLPGADLTVDLHDLPEGRLPAVWERAQDT